MPDDERRRLRGCDVPEGECDPAVDFEWWPGEEPLGRCPWAILSEAPEVFELMDWIEDWEVFQALPFEGYGQTPTRQPFFVYQTLIEHARIKAEERQRQAEEIEAEQEKAKRAGGKSRRRR